MHPADLPRPLLLNLEDRSELERSLAMAEKQEQAQRPTPYLPSKKPNTDYPVSSLRYLLEIQMELTTVFSSLTTTRMFPEFYEAFWQILRLRVATSLTDNCSFHLHRHISRVIRYARPSDYAWGVGVAAVQPSLLLWWEQVSPSHVGRGGFAPLMRLNCFLGVCAGFLYFAARSTCMSNDGAGPVPCGGVPTSVAYKC